MDMLNIKNFTAILNLGLLSGQKSIGSIKYRQFLDGNKNVKVIDESIGEGEYLDEYEPTYVVKLSVKNFAEFHNMLEVMCDKFGQECIAYYLPRNCFGKLVYNLKFSGEKMQFNKDFFIEL